METAEDPRALRLKAPFASPKRMGTVSPYPCRFGIIRPRWG